MGKFVVETELKSDIKATTHVIGMFVSTPGARCQVYTLY